jgi:hypothetical protein
LWSMKSMVNFDAEAVASFRPWGSQGVADRWRHGDWESPWNHWCIDPICLYIVYIYIYKYTYVHGLCIYIYKIWSEQA